VEETSEEVVAAARVVDVAVGERLGVIAEEVAEESVCRKDILAWVAAGDSAPAMEQEVRAATPAEASKVEALVMGVAMAPAA
jgi:hypothetical protein